MKYIIIDNNSDGTINEITDDPVDFIGQFEPIDVVGGKLLALDEEGRMYHFESKSKVGRNPSRFPISIVEVGEWLEGEPLMVRTEGNYIDKLRTVLINQLKRADKKKTRWRLARRKVDNSVHKDYSILSTDRLIQEVEATIN